LPASHLTEKDAGQSSASGKALFYSHGCVACHSIGHIGGQFAPALDGISKHRDLDFVISRINAAEFLNARGSDEYQERGVVMPPSNLSEKEIGHIAQFLMSLP
jgi:cytochrome c551/c552